MDQQARAYEHQLVQVKKRLLLKPHDESLKALEANIINLITLHKSLKSQEIRRQRTRVSTLPRKIQDESAGGEIQIKVSIGEKCQALNENGEWATATVQSVSADKSHVTVIFSGASSARHCTWREVRNLPPTLRTFTDKRGATEASRAPPKITKQILKKPRPSSKADYLKKKEEEHTEKQEAWKSFSKKIGLNHRAPPNKKP